MYKNPQTGKEITESLAKSSAEGLGLTLEQWQKEYGFSPVGQGKTTASGTTTQVSEAETNTPAGDSSSGDISLESQKTNPYHITLEDLEGSDTDVQKRLARKLRAIGIGIDEEIPLVDAVNLKSLTSKNSLGDAQMIQVREGLFTDLMSEDNLKKINEFIDQYGDGEYANTLKSTVTKDGRTTQDLYEEQQQRVRAVSVTAEQSKEWIKSKWFAKIEEKRKAVASIGAAGVGSIGGVEGDINKVIQLKPGDFETKTEYKEYLDWKESGEINVSEERLDELQRLALAEAQDKTSKTYARNLSDRDRENVETVAQYEAQALDTELKQRSKELAATKTALETDALELEKDIALFNENPVSEATYNELKKRGANIIATQLKYELKYEGFKNLLESEETEEAFRAAKDLSLNYSMLDKLGVNFKKTAIDLGYGAYQIANIAGAVALKGFNEEAVKLGVKSSEADFKNILEESAEETAQYDTGVAFDDIFSGDDVLGNMVNWAGNTATQAIPSLTLAFAGPAAMPLFFFSGYGSTAAESAVKEYEAVERVLTNGKTLQLNEEYNVQVARLLSDGMNQDAAEQTAYQMITEKYQGNDEMSNVNFIITGEEKISLEKQMTADQELINIPSYKEVGLAAVAGAAEVLFERLGTIAILKGTNKALSAAPRKREILKSVLKSSNQEGLSEGATEFTNNFARMAIMGEEVNLFEGVTESYFGGLLIGGPLELKSAAPAVYAHMAHESMTSSELKQYKAKIKELGTLIGDQNLSTLLNPKIELPSNLSPAVVELVQEVQEQGGLLQDQAIERLENNLTTEEIIELGEINMRMRQVNTRLLEAARGSVSQAEIKATAASLEKKFNALSDRRESLLGNLASQEQTGLEKANTRGSLAFKSASMIVSSNQLTLKKMNSGKAFEKLTFEQKSQKIAEAKGDENLAKENYFLETNKKALEENRLQAEQLLKDNGLEGKVFSKTDAEFRALADAEFDKLSDKDREKLIEETSSKTEKAAKENYFQSINGLELNGDVYVNIDASARNGKVGTFMHEAFHAMVKNTVGDGAANKAGEQLLEFLEANDAEASAYIQNHLEVNYDIDGVKNAAYYEEALTGLSDYLSEGNTVELNTVSKINRFFNNVLGKRGKGLNLSDGASTFEFITRYAAKNKGEKSDAAISKFIQDNIKKEEKDDTPVVPLETEQKAAASKSKLSKTLSSEQNSQVVDLLKKRNERKSAAEEAAKKFGVEPQADAIQQRLETRIREALSPLVGKIVTNRTKALYDPIAPDARNNVSREDFQSSLRTEVEALAFEEYKEGKQDIEKFLVNRAFLRANNLASRLGIESAEAGIKQDVETAKGIAVEAETTKETKEAPKYISLTESKTVSAETKGKIKDKLKTVARTQGARMDLSEGKNVSVRKYIKNIRDGVGNLAWDIIRQDSMYSENAKGKRSLDQAKIRKFLSSKGLFIAQNLTTTTLQVKMPQLVQKKLAETGEFVSYPAWVGKKIARASVESKGKEGKTSGDFEVKRLSDAQMRAQAKIDGTPVKNLNVAQLAVLEYMFDSVGINAAGNVEVSGLKRANPKALSKDLAAEAAFEILNEELQNPESEVRQAFKDNQEGLGVALTENFVTEVARDAERGSAKYSRNVAQILNNEGQLKWEAGKTELAERLAGVSNGITRDVLRDELSEVYGDLFTKPQYTKIANELIKIFKNVDAVQLTAATEVVGDFMEILEGMDNQADFGEAVHALTKAASNVTELFRDKNKILEAKQTLINIITKANVPVNIAKTFINSTFANSGKTGRYKSNGEVSGSNRADLFYNTSYVVKALVGEGKLYTQEQWNNAETITTSASVQAQHLNGKYADSKDLQQKDAKAAKEAWNLTTEIVKGLKGKSPEMQAMIMAAMNSGTNTVLRLAAPVTHIAKGFNSKNIKAYRYEHVVPARVVLALMYKSYVLGDSSINLDALKKDYTVAIIPKTMDKVVGDAGLGGRQIHGYIPGEVSPWKRYYNILTKGKIQYAVESFADGSVQGESYAQAFKAVSGLAINNKNLAKAKETIKEIESAPKAKLSKSNRTPIDQKFNEILERKTGIEAFKTFSDVQAEIRGRNKGKFKFFIAPAVDDFRGLVNFAFSGKGKQGEIDKQWLEDTLMTPYAKGISAIEGIRQQIKRDFKQAVKAFPKQYKLLNESVGTTPFTYDHAVRVYLWQKAGITTIPGLSKKDTKVLQDAIQAQPELMEFANSLLVVARREAWMEPTAHWVGGTVLSDLNGMTEKIGRKKYLEEFIQNAEVVFSPENLNKIEAAFGKDHREAIEDSLYSMINGTNRTTGTNKTVGKWLNWINGSTGAIMFFNRRSALLQMLSTVNFINYSDNNPLKAAAAFANQKQYWKDFAMIFNSDKLKERRGGLQQDVSANEIASIANQDKRSPQALLAYLLKIGFTPTQVADSMAIASGGATFYRNRIKTYLKQDMSPEAAEERAFLDFSKISDETQQSSDPALVSQVQRSVLGRIVFAFQNTPMQMTRLMKKDALDLINGRGDWKVKVSRIAYYGMIQNAIFSSLQSALFALIPGFDDEDEENLTEEELLKKNAREEGKITRALNSMLDTLLRGSGVYGAILASAKNVIREYNKQESRGFLGDHSYTILSLFDISPPIGSKARKINTAIKTRTFEKDAIAERGWAVTAEGRLNLGPNWSILGNVVSATTNVPLDRVVAELTSISEAMNAKHTAWQRVAMAAGWKTWDVGVKNEVNEEIKEEAKALRKEEGIIKAAETRERNKAKKKAAEEAFIEEQTKGMSDYEKDMYIRALKKKQKEERKQKKEKPNQQSTEDPTAGMSDYERDVYLRKQKELNKK